MSSGLPWEKWIGQAAACPPEFPFWTKVILPGGEPFLCLDRGSKVITTADGKVWIDLLVYSPPVPYGAEVVVEVVYPEG